MSRKKSIHKQGYTIPVYQPPDENEMADGSCDD